MTIEVPAQAFVDQLQRFRELMARPGQPFRDFTTGAAYDEEFYKTRVRDEALLRLQLPWNRAAVGSGKLIERVINAIEIENPKGVPKGWRHNNLVQWEAKWGAAQRPHQALYVAQSDSAKKLACESALFDFFADKIEPAEAMAKFISVFGKRYEVISFLFFLKDWEQFMQVRSTHFQKAFSMLGVRWNGEAPKLVAQCSWDNYAAFNETLSIVRDYLLDEGIPERSTDRCTLLLLGLILPDVRRGRYKAPDYSRDSARVRIQSACSCPTEECCYPRSYSRLGRTAT